MVEVILISAYTDADLASLETLAREGTFVFIMHFANFVHPLKSIFKS